MSQKFCKWSISASKCGETELDAKDTQAHLSRSSKPLIPEPRHR